MRVAFIGDVHLENYRSHGGSLQDGINHRCREVLHVLDQAIRAAEDHRVDALVVLGDLLHTARPAPQILHAIQEIFRKLSRPVAIIVGNHERIGSGTNNSLMPLQVDATEVFTKPWVRSVGREYLAMIPYRPGKATEWLPPSIEEAFLFGGDKRCAALCLHIGIHDEELCQANSWMRHTEDAVSVEYLANLANQYGIPRIVAGHWHRRQEWLLDGVRITQVGALAPTGWDNPGLEGYGAVELLGCAKECITIPSPRFLKLGWADICGDAVMVKRALAHADAASLYLRVKVHPDKLLSARERMGAIAASHERIRGWEVVTDQAVASALARESATTARSAETLRDAVVGYIDELQMADTGQIRKLVLRYLNLEG